MPRAALGLEVLVDLRDGGSDAIEKGPGNHADQNDQDFQEFVKAVRSGRIEALEGV